MRKYLLIFLVFSVGQVFASVGDTPYTLAVQNNATQTTVDYILDKSSLTEGDRKITNLCIGDTDVAPHWQLFYSSTGTSSGMPDTIFPFYGLSEKGQFIKPHGSDSSGALMYYNSDYLGRIPFDDVRENINKCMMKMAYQIGYEKGEEGLFTMLTADKPIKDFFTRMDDLDKMEISFGFGTGVWQELNETDNGKVANCFVASGYLPKDKFVFNSKGPTITIKPGTSVKDRQKIINSFIGYIDLQSKCVVKDDKK